MDLFKHGELTFNLMVEASPNAMILVNNLGKIEYINGFAEVLFQYERTELIGSNLKILIPDTFNNTHPSLIKSYINNPVRRQMGENKELNAIKKDGSEFPVEIGLNPIVTENGTLVLAAIIDITERKKAEKQFRLVVESVPNAIILVNSKGEITMTNKQTEKQFGYINEELIGEKLEILIPERFRNNHISFRDKFHKNPQTRSMGVGRDLFALRKDGTEFPAEIGLNPIKTETGTHILTSIIDITERKKLEDAIQVNTRKIENQNQELKISEQKLKESNATKDKFFSIIGHDLKNPFNIILGFTNMLIDSYALFDDDEKKKFITDINVSAKTAYTLLENLLTWALSQQGGIVLEKEEIDLAAFIQESISPYVHSSSEKNIDISINIPVDLKIVTDKSTMSTVIRNIVNNAIKFTPEGGSIQIAINTYPEKIELLIRDTGVGMSDEQRNKLFKIEGNNSTLGTNQEEGTGLGLILCKEFVEKNGGTLRFESEPGQGSVFIITLSLVHN